MFLKLHDKEDGAVFFLSLRCIAKIYTNDGETTIETTEGYERPRESVPEIMEAIANAEKRQCAK